MNILEKAKAMQEQFDEENRCLAAYLTNKTFNSPGGSHVLEIWSESELFELFKKWIEDCRSMGANKHVMRDLQGRGVCLEDFGLSLPTKS